MNPGNVEDALPFEPSGQRSVFMGSGLAASQRPGMTINFTDRLEI
jgi:hypothetical protein